MNPTKRTRQFLAEVVFTGGLSGVDVQFFQQEMNQYVKTYYFEMSPEKSLEYNISTGEFKESRLNQYFLDVYKNKYGINLQFAVDQGQASIRNIREVQLETIL